LNADSESRRSLLAGILWPLLFFSPDVHLRDLEKIWADKIINLTDWNKFIARLKEEWNNVSVIVSYYLSHVEYKLNL
jgi:hypothetical protein